MFNTNLTKRLGCVAIVAALAMPWRGFSQQVPAPAPMAGMAAEASMMTAMQTMSQSMAAVPMTGNADRDFAAMMIPHHHGAIDMARFELANGKDPAMRKLAEAIMSAQESEIAEMQAWLQAPAPPP